MRTIRDIVEEMQRTAETPEFQARVAQLERETAEQQAVRADTERRLYLATSGIPAKCHPWLDSPQETPAMTAVRKALAQPGQMFLVLSGPAGRGKTAAIAWGAYSKHGRFADSATILQASTYDMHLWDDLYRTPVLALDELGTEYVNEAFRSNLFALLNRRSENLRPTLISTNLDGAAFMQRYASGPMERMADRLRAGGQWVNLPGESMRQHWSETNEQGG